MNYISHEAPRHLPAKTNQGPWEVIAAFTSETHLAPSMPGNVIPPGGRRDNSGVILALHLFLRVGIWQVFIDRLLCTCYCALLVWKV